MFKLQLPYVKGEVIPMRSFHNIAKLIKTKRVEHTKRYSQSELSLILGYKNGQFISNVERGLCSIPLKMLSTVASVLDITHEEIKAAVLRDFEETVTNYINTDFSKEEIAAGEDE